MENVFYLNKDLQIEKCKREAVAIAYFFKDKCVDSLYELGPKRFEKNVEITFFEPIGHDANLKASVKLQSNWQKENYPSYQSFLPSEDMCKLIMATTHRKFDNCWTRTYEDDGWPSYRYFPVLIKDGTSYLSDCSFVADNVYVSLVLTKEQFLEINPEVNLI
jgi:hypothetical protein